jgi:hypothetical protein
MSTDPLHPDAPVLIGELTAAGWTSGGFTWTGSTRTSTLISPSRTLHLRVQTGGAHGARLVFDAPVRAVQYGWLAEAPLLPPEVIAAVAAANDDEQSTYFAERDDRQIELLAEAGWSDESFYRWVSPDRRTEVESGDIEGTAYAIRVGRDGGATQILLTECASDQVLYAFATGSLPPRAAEATVEPAPDAAEQSADNEPFTVSRGWGRSATASERGQQYIRLALALDGAEDWPLDCPGLFDRVADSVPLILADLHALAYRIGLDTARLGLDLRHP